MDTIVDMLKNVERFDNLDHYHVSCLIPVDGSIKRFEKCSNWH